MSFLFGSLLGWSVGVFALALLKIKGTVGE